MKLSAKGLLFFWLCLAPLAASSLEPPLQVVKGQGFQSWAAPESARSWRLDRLAYELKDRNHVRREKVLEELGFERARVGRTLHWQDLEEPITMQSVKLSFSDRPLTVVSFPHKGRGTWALVVFEQQPEKDDLRFWRPRQLFIFDTDPVPGLGLKYPDILSDGMQEMAARHLVKDGVHGNREVVSIFKWDERGPDARLRLTWQETDLEYRAGKFQGKPSWTESKLTYGNQRIERSVRVRQYAFTDEGELEHYKGVEPTRTENYRERFSWNPAQFLFYDGRTELEKLSRNKSELVRREAARRLGNILSTSHRILVDAAVKDKSAYVRMQAALALGEIGDRKALPALKKAAANTREDDTVREAQQAAVDHLESLPKNK